MARVTYPGYKKYIYVRKKNMVRVNWPGHRDYQKNKKKEAWKKEEEKTFSNVQGLFVARVTYPGYKKYIYVKKNMVRVNRSGNRDYKKKKKKPEKTEEENTFSNINKQSKL